MTRKTCWCCSKEEEVFESELCFPCWSWAETHLQSGASEQAIRLAWREAHPDFKTVQTQIGPAKVRAVAPNEVNVEIAPFTLNGIAYNRVYIAANRNNAGAFLWRVSSAVYLSRETGGDGTDKARRAVYDAALFAAAEATKDDERWLTVGAATHFDREIEHHRRKIQDEGEEIERLVEAQRTFLRAKLIEEVQR
jgi:hypothetical protein